jgi:hypothetical protein
VAIAAKMSFVSGPPTPATHATRVSLPPSAWIAPVLCERCRLRLATAICWYERPVIGSMPPVGRTAVVASRSRKRVFL